MHYTVCWHYNASPYNRETDVRARSRQVARRKFVFRRLH